MLLEMKMIKKRKRLLKQAEEEKEKLEKEQKEAESKRGLMGMDAVSGGGATGGTTGGATGGAGGGLGGAGGDAAGEGAGMDFNYLPHFGGIPFPPVAVGGVNYHAPMHVTINTLPYPNPRAYEDPYTHANRHLKLQRKLIRAILRKRAEDAAGRSQLQCQ